MVVSKWAVEEYLSQPKDDFRWMKELLHKDLDEAINGLVPKPDFEKPGLDLHQKVGFMLGVSYGSFYLQYDIGTGKTRISLELIKWRMKAGIVKRALVLVPTDTLARGWRDEIIKWCPDLPWLLLLDMNSTEKLEQLLAMEEGIAIVTYQAFYWMVAKLVPTKKKKQELEIVEKLVKQVIKRIDFFVCDEITKISSRDSGIFMVLRRMAKVVPYRLALAGRPFGKDPIVLWSQYFIVDLGATLGETVGLFREAFYNAISKFGKDSGHRPWWLKKAGKAMAYAMDYKLKPEMEDTLARFLANRALYYSSDECVDLPPLMTIERSAPLPAQQKSYYDNLVKARWQGKSKDNTFLRMRQISSGFMGVKDEDGEKAEVIFKENPKLELLLDVLNEMPPGKQAIICTEFTPSGRIIHEALTKLRMPHGWVWGGTKNYDEIKQAYDTTPGYHMIGQWKKMGIGTNYQTGNYVIFYDIPTNPIDYEQFYGRVRRKGSKEMGHERIYVFDLLIEGTKDRAIREAIEEGNDLHARILKNPRLLYETGNTKDAARRLERGRQILAEGNTQRPDSPRTGPMAAARALPGIQGSHRSGIRRRGVIRA